MIYHTWFCLNRNCLHEFTTDDGVDDPSCPRCTGSKTQWLPKNVNVVSQKTRAADNIVSDLKATYGDKNYRSPAIGQPMIPKPQIVPVTGRSMPFTPAGSPIGGIALPLDPNGKVYPGSYCAPTGVTSLVSANVGVKTPLDKRAATPTGAIPVFEARHRP